MERQRSGGKCLSISLGVIMTAVVSLAGRSTYRVGVASPVGQGPSEAAQNVDALPPSGTYKIDPEHAFAYFSAWHHFVGRVRGRFDRVTGSIEAAQDPAACSVAVTIDISSLSTQVKERDDDLLSAAYFDVEKFPSMTYRGKGLHRLADGTWRMDGSLSLHGVTKAVPLTITYRGSFPRKKPQDPIRAAFHASAAVKRADFGMGARDNLDEVGLSPAADVEIEIDVEADAVSHT